MPACCFIRCSCCLNAIADASVAIFRLCGPHALGFLFTARLTCPWSPLRGPTPRRKALLVQRAALAASATDSAARQVALVGQATALASRTTSANATAAASVYALSSARQDLALSLARAGGELVAAAGDDEATPFSTAAVVMRGDASMAEAAEATAAAVRRLLGGVVAAIRSSAGGDRRRPPPSPTAVATAAEVLASRLRDAEDHAEMLTGADEVLRSNVEAAVEDADSTASELALRRNQIVKLALALGGAAPGAAGKGVPGGEGERSAAAGGVAAPAGAVKAAGGGTADAAVAAGDGDPGGGAPAAAADGAASGSVAGALAGTPAGAQADTAAGGGAGGPPPADASLAARLAAVEVSNKDLRAAAAARLAELGAALEATRSLAVAAERTAASRDKLQSTEVLGAGLYQAMEESLTGLALAQREWETSRESAIAARRTAAEAAAAELAELRSSTATRAASLSKALTDALKGAEAAKAARDRLNLTYEARKLEVGADRGAADTGVVLARATERQVRACGGQGGRPG